MKAMIFAAGLGTRLKPWTDFYPKALAVVNRRTLLQHNVEWLQSWGFADIIVNVHHFADQIIKVVEKNKGWGCRITISDERDNLLETGGGLAKAAPFFANEKYFIAMNVDVLTDLSLPKMIAQHIETRSIATLATTDRTSSRNFLFNEKNLLCGWRNDATGEEKISVPAKNYTKRAFSGMHFLSTKIFDYLPPVSKYSIVDPYLELCKTLPITSFDHSGYPFVDVGKPESIAQAEKMFK